MRAIIKFRYLVVILAAVVMVFGVIQLRHMPVDVLPEFAPPHVEIQTEALGLSAEEVEQLITVPLEHNLLNGVPWIDKIYSDSVSGLSAIKLTFEPGTDLYRARQMVAERLARQQPRFGCPAFVKNNFRDPDVRARALDNHALPDGRARCGQRGGLGDARPPIAGASGPGPSARLPGFAAPTGRISRECAVGFAVELRGGGHARQRRLC